jgi:hypothetical protein
MGFRKKAANRSLAASTADIGHTKNADFDHQIACFVIGSPKGMATPDRVKPLGLIEGGSSCRLVGVTVITGMALTGMGTGYC